jgi:ribosome-associated toxin RatA of RatAB toxin-antitoxin module
VQSVEESVVIRAPQAALFELTQDYGLRLKWDPFVRAMRFLDGATKAAVGVRVWVRAWTGLTMTAQFVSMNRPHVVAMKMLRGPFLFRRFVGTWRFAPARDGVRVTFHYAFETRWRRLRWLLDPVIRGVFRCDIRARLRGLKRGAEKEHLLERLPVLPPV